jgi:hypothetical protein
MVQINYQIFILYAAFLNIFNLLYVQPRPKKKTNYFI